ncbi:MAG: hypothetical protein E7342_03940 [Clostridiales bacterium]|nr:hypothetical protein [Clostridiales bacterium]
MCVLAILTSANGNGLVKGTALKVVASSSMCTKYEGNEYLFKNDLDDQLLLFDLILVHELPKEEDIKLYDIVVYEHINGAFFIHRIVDIEEPNEKHPNERYFLLQGDANAVADVFPVKYSQLRSIYEGERVANLGSFVLFMQSPAGILCIVLLIFVLVTMPIVDEHFVKLEYERVERMIKDGELDENARKVFETYLKRLKKKKKEGKDNEKN